MQGVASFLGGLSCEDVCSLLPRCTFAGLDPLNVRGDTVTEEAVHVVCNPADLALSWAGSNVLAAGNGTGRI